MLQFIVGVYSSPNVFFVWCAILDLENAINELLTNTKWTQIRKRLGDKQMKKPSDLLVKVSRDHLLLNSVNASKILLRQ